MKKAIELTEQQLEDIASALSFTVENYPKKGSENFRADCEKLLKRIWKKIKEK